MKKQRLPATSTQLTLTPDRLAATKAFLKRHWQCISKDKTFEYILLPPDDKPVLICRYCKHYPKRHISFRMEDFDAIRDFTDSHKCKKTFSLVSSDCSVGTALSIYCMECGDTKTLTDAGE